MASSWQLLKFLRPDAITKRVANISTLFLQTKAIYTTSWILKPRALDSLVGSRIVSNYFQIDYYQGKVNKVVDAFLDILSKISKKKLF